MRRLKTITLVAALIGALASTIYADGPCAPDPGQMNTPPCSSANPVGDDNVTPGEIVPSSPTSDTSEYLVAEVTVEVIANLLTLI